MQTPAHGSSAESHGRTRRPLVVADLMMFGPHDAARTHPAVDAMEDQAAIERRTAPEVRRPTVPRSTSGSSSDPACAETRRAATTISGRSIGTSSNASGRRRPASQPHACAAAARRWRMVREAMLAHAEKSGSGRLVKPPEEDPDESSLPLWEARAQPARTRTRTSAVPRPTPSRPCWRSRHPHTAPGRRQHLVVRSAHPCQPDRGRGRSSIPRTRSLSPDLLRRPTSSSCERRAFHLRPRLRRQCAGAGQPPNGAGSVRSSKRTSLWPTTRRFDRACAHALQPRGRTRAADVRTC